MLLAQEMSLGKEMSESAGDNDKCPVPEPDVFEIVLPISILVLSDDDFLHDDIQEEAAASVPELKEVMEEVNSNNSIFIKDDVTPSNDSHSLSICEESKTASNKDNSTKYSEEKWVAENVCNTSESSLSGQGEARTDKQSQNYALPTSSSKTELTEINGTGDRKDCGGDDGFEKVPPLISSAGNEDRDEAMETSRQLVSAEISKHEEKHVIVASVLSDGSREKQPEVQKELETVIKIEDPDPSKNGGNETNNRKRSEFEDETWSCLLENGLKEELKFTSNCSAPFLNGCSPTSEELLKDVGILEMSASAESNTTGEHIYKTLTQFPEKRYQQQEVSPHESLKELQSQQEDLAWLSNSVTIKPVSKVSCSTNKQERLNLKCRFCSSVYKCSAHLKKHVYSAHKDKKTHKCCFCKRTFFFFVNLKKHLKLHKKMSRLKRARKNRMSMKKIRQRRCEEEKSGAKNRGSKYEQFFIKIEKDFSPLGMPVNFSCKICFFASSNPRSFVQHMKGHKERPPYQCPQCDYSFISFSYLLNHMYWHAGYKLYQCRFCTFFSLYFASMVRHSYIHLRGKQHSCEFCQAAFASTVELQRHRRLHAGNETHQGQQPSFVSRRKRTRRPLKSYTCDECNLVFSNRGHLNFHEKSHERFKVTANGYQSNKYRKSKICKVESNSQDHVSLSLSGQADDCLSGGMLASEVDFEQEGDVQDNKEMCFGRKFPENGHGSNSLPVIENRSDVLLNSYKMETLVCEGKPLFSSEASCSQAQDDDAYHKFVENLKTTWPSNLCAFRTYKCQHCSYATAVHSDFKLHLKTHTVGRPFVRKECNTAFKTSNHLQKHSFIHAKNSFEFGHWCCVGSSLQNLELHHEMQADLCPERDFGSSEGSNSVHYLLGSELCRLQPDVQRGKNIDLQARSQRQYYQCAECEYATCFLSNLKVHVRTHTGEKPYSCSVCQKKFRTSSHLKRHNVLHFNTEFLKCRNCDYSTNNWLSLKQHLASHSCGESSPTGCLHGQKEQLPFKTYTCEECGYCTVHNSNLKPHLRIHTGEKPFKCDQCPLTFRTSSHLKRHLRTHSKLRCRRCEFSTVDKRAFQRHIKTHAKMYKCGKCNVTLPTKKLLEKHKRQHKVGI